MCIADIGISTQVDIYQREVALTIDVDSPIVRYKTKMLTSRTLSYKI